MTANSPRRTLSAFLVMASASTVFLDYWEYSRSFYAEPNIWAGTLHGEAAAPAQYRIGVLKAAEFLSSHSPLAMRHALALIDFVALLIAAFALRTLLTRSQAWRSASLAAKWFGAAAFVALFQYSLLWITWFQRPETLTIAALLALSLWLSTHRLPIAGTPGIILTALCLILLGIAQGFTRADAGFAFHLGIALVCLTRFSKDFALPRWTQFSASLAAAAAAAGVQLYLMRVVYPHTTYGTTPIFQLAFNLTEPRRIAAFLLFMIPTIWIAVQIARRRTPLQPPQAGLLVGSAIFFCLWCVVGSIVEVRIFLPFALALAPLTVETAMRHIAASEAR